MLRPDLKPAGSYVAITVLLTLNLTLTLYSYRKVHFVNVLAVTYPILAISIYGSGVSIDMA